MPFLNIHTNVELNPIAKDEFLMDALEFVADKLGKPKERTIINYMYNKDILFGVLKADFGALIELKAIGFPENRADLALSFTHFIHYKLGIDFEHIEIEFIDMPGSTLSIAGKLRG